MSRLMKSVLNTRGVGPSCDLHIDTVISISIKKIPTKIKRDFGKTLLRIFTMYKNYILRGKGKYYKELSNTERIQSFLKPMYLYKNKTNIIPQIKNTKIKKKYGNERLWMITHAYVLLYVENVIRVMANIAFQCQRRNEMYKTMRVIRASSYMKNHKLPEYFTNELRKYNHRIDNLLALTEDLWKLTKDEFVSYKPSNYKL